MPEIKVLSRMEYPAYRPDGAIQVQYLFTVQVDDGIPLTVSVNKEGYQDQLLREAVKGALAERERQERELRSHTIPL